jgi:hypothetical protein
VILAARGSNPLNHPMLKYFTKIEFTFNLKKQNHKKIVLHQKWIIFKKKNQIYTNSNQNKSITHITLFTKNLIKPYISYDIS